MPKTIIIVEDSPSAGALLKSLLEQSGYQVFWAENGEKGVGIAGETAPDLVITDTLLPGIDGFEVCRRIKRRMGETVPKVIVVTGSIDAVDAVRARKAGADDYCVKTSDFSSLTAAVDRMLADK